MATQTTYTDARAHLARYMDDATSSREPIIIRRRNSEDVALIAASELEGLLETAHLLRSPKNAERLLAALARAQEGGEPVSTLAALRDEVGLGGE
jgi:antitoxin YefM